MESQSSEENPTEEHVTELPEKPEVDYRIEEWKRLNDEIKTNTTRMHAALVLALGGTTAIFGVAKDIWWPGAAYFCLLPFLLLIPASLFITSQMASTQRIASYLRTYFESANLGLAWESRLVEVEEQIKRKRIGGRFSNSLSYILGGAAWTSGLIGYYFLYFPNPEFKEPSMEFCKDWASEIEDYAIPLGFSLLFGIGVITLFIQNKKMRKAMKFYQKLYDSKWGDLNPSKEKNKDMSDGKNHSPKNALIDT